MIAAHWRLLAGLGAFIAWCALMLWVMTRLQKMRRQYPRVEPKQSEWWK